MYKLYPSQAKNKKYSVTDPNGHTIHFGDNRYEDFTTHKNVNRRTNYLSRHQNEDWTDLTKPGTWSRYILWNKPTISESLDDLAHKFNIQIAHFH